VRQGVIEMIYIIEAIVGEKSLFKIGTTKFCPTIRLNQLKNQNAAHIKLVGAMIGNKQDEELFHSAFRIFRKHGEWFSDCKGIRKLVEDFPIQVWDEVMEELKSGKIEPEDAFYNLTLLRFEDNSAIVHQELKRVADELRSKPT